MNFSVSTPRMMPFSAPQFQGRGWGTTTDQDGDPVATFNGKPVYGLDADGDPATYSRNGQRLSYPIGGDMERVGNPVVVDGRHILNIAEDGDVRPYMYDP